jgi:pyruvate kinase
MQKKHTKIVATISDQRCSPDHIRDLFNAGMNVVRLNTAHQDMEGSQKVIDVVRSVSDEIAILLDTKGPEIRTTVARDPVELVAGETIEVVGDPDLACIPGRLSVSYPGFAEDVKPGNRILIDDGEIELVAQEKKGNSLICRVVNPGFVKSHKSINVPEVKISLPALSPRDREYIDFAIRNDLEFIAHSFVRRKEDVMAIQEILRKNQSKIKIIAKIENQEGVDNLDEILNLVYGIMVARGDLGIEVPGEKIPGIQRRIMKACIRRKKPVIVATQMLYTMIEHPRPTRAEISDVANAVYNGTDALMLSGETAFGQYPVEAVGMMTRIAREVESARESMEVSISSIDNEIAAFLANTAYRASRDLNTDAVVIDTLTGRTGRYMAAFRNRNPVHAACYSKRVMREMALSFGIFPFYMDPEENTDNFKRAVVSRLVSLGELQRSDRIIVVGGSFGPRKGASFMEISKVSDLVGN